MQEVGAGDRRESDRKARCEGGAAAPARVLAKGILRPERARGKQGVKFLLVHGFPSTSSLLFLFLLEEASVEFRDVFFAFLFLEKIQVDAAHCKDLAQIIGFSFFDDQTKQAGAV